MTDMSIEELSRKAKEFDERGLSPGALARWAKGEPGDSQGFFKKAVVEQPVRRLEAETGRMSEKRLGRAQKITEISFGINLWDRFKPVILGSLLILFLIGPGSLAIAAILSSINIPIAIGAIIIGIILWRRRR